ncbi:hypothetical protein LMIY3S_05510 [Labrys miyagiensis]
MTPKINPDFRIRAADAWSQERGREAPHIPFSASDKTELRRLADVIEYRTARSLILSQGQPATFLYLVVSGLVAASRTLNSGERQIIAFYWPGDLFGLAEDGVYVNGCEALTPCTVYRFPLRKLESFLLENPTAQQGFLVKAIHDLRSTQRQLLVMGRFNIAQRLAIFLLDCSGHELYFDAAGQVLTLPMTRYDIADYLGTSAESVTRAFGQLEDKGLLRRLSATNVSLSVASLRAFAEI